jgi:hypothetical protein
VSHRQLGLPDLVAWLLIGGRGEDLGVGQGELPLWDLLGPFIGEYDAEVGVGIRNR